MGSFYRRIDVCMWGDAKFAELSAPTASGQWLWIWLLTGPFTTMVPGLVLTGQRAAAEALGWSDREFNRCWEEIADRGMAVADWRARIVWIPRALRYNPPANQLVVRKWPREIGRAPACELRSTILHEIAAEMTVRGPAFALAFEESFGPVFGVGGDGRHRSAKQATPMLGQKFGQGVGLEPGQGVGLEPGQGAGQALSLGVGVGMGIGMGMGEGVQGEGDEPELELARLFSQIRAEFPTAETAGMLKRWKREGLAEDIARRALRATLKARPSDPVAYAQAVVERTLEKERRAGIRNGRRKES